jgi:hypothetical protein
MDPIQEASKDDVFRTCGRTVVGAEAFRTGNPFTGPTPPAAALSTPGSLRGSRPLVVDAPHDDDELPAGLDGIDEQRILEAILRLEEVAKELGWATVLRVYADLTRRREQA